MSVNEVKINIFGDYTLLMLSIRDFFQVKSVSVWLKKSFNSEGVVGNLTMACVLRIK